MKNYRDFYFRKAKAENYPARSIYKLKEIDARYRILRRGMKVLDLGAAPGSWTLGCAEIIGQDGFIAACDIQATDTVFPPQVRFFREDIFNPTPDFIAALEEISPFDVVLSDMAPATTGSKFTDQARSFELASAAFETARAWLKNGGSFVVKVFMGPDAQTLPAQMRSVFGRVATFKPKSSRSESREIFFIGLDFLGNRQRRDHVGP